MQWFRMVVAVIAAFTTAVGLTLDATQITQIDTRWWTLIAFVIFLVFVIWMLLELQTRNKDLENKKPSIRVTPVFDEGLWYLNVTNNGERGIFSAQVVIIQSKDNPLGISYDAVWGKTNTDKSELMNGHSDIIKIAGIKYIDTAEYFDMKAYDTVNKCQYAVRHIELGDARDITDHQDIKVIISSDPSLKDGPLIKAYSISLHNIEELKHQPELKSVIPDRYILGDPEDFGLEPYIENGEKEKIMPESFHLVWLSEEFFLRGSHNDYHSYNSADEDGKISLVIKPKIKANTLKQIQIQSIALRIGTKEIPSDMKDIHVFGESETIDDIKFEFLLDTPRGKQLARIKAIVDGEEYLSNSFLIDFPGIKSKLPP